MLDTSHRPGIPELIETCGEVVKACGQILGTDNGGYEPREHLQGKLADLLATISFVIHFGTLDDAAIQKRAYAKRVQLEYQHTSRPEKATP